MRRAAPPDARASTRATRLAAALVACAAVALAVPASAAVPSPGTFAPGISLGGVELGMTRADVIRAWGRKHGVCRNCARTTWYFNYRPFHPEGAGVVFERGRVAHVFTVWRPRGWRTADGLVLGAPEADIGRANVIVDERQCGRYSALLSPGPSAQTVFYVYREKLWGFGLVRPGANPCL